MDTVLIILAVLCALIGVAGCILPALPGTPVCFLGLLLSHWSGNEMTQKVLITAAVITIFVSVADYYLPIWFTKRFGGSKQATRGSMIGIVAGLFFMPWGIILGPFLGAFLGELMNDDSDSKKAFRVAFGSFAAFFFGTGLKLVASGWMTFLIIKGIFV